MPTVLNIGPYRFIFFSSDKGEPVHIHVVRDRQIAKFWLEPIKLEKNRGFKDHELNKIIAMIKEHKETILEEWHDYFGT
ncbi:DUF4160 domain-containing protein [cf. Phormidesmis sp. LEGE 11477]|uniref:DUF4160 domain-containing protein n=1 Tax=cf. Phormidesmis sp. LEGE 11477 TaxID=1828680 RepID=UPI00187E2157|nr:DUF4160 domain-containing protein [cf. Phormidesmis sp. LEGE 11477]MBE9063980.1 DUF4160 domain-containing protein [cf. Phormidesmis sp. LEGE 11477]